MAKKMLFKLNFCSLLLLSLVLMACDPMSSAAHHVITIRISAETPDNVDSVQVCVSSDGDEYSCSSRFYYVICDKGFMSTDGEECGDEYSVQVKFYCSAGVSSTQPYTAPISLLDTNELFFWNYEERLLIDDYSAYKLVDFYPPSDTTCGKIVNYALMRKEE